MGAGRTRRKGTDYKDRGRCVNRPAGPAGHPIWAPRLRVPEHRRTL